MIVSLIPMGLSLLLLIAAFKAYKAKQGDCPNCKKLVALRAKKTPASNSLEEGVLDAELLDENMDLLVCKHCKHELSAASVSNNQSKN